jgi:hypothetical protein
LGKERGRWGGGDEGESAGNEEVKKRGRGEDDQQGALPIMIFGCGCRCQLPSGKTVWLCKPDQKTIDRITVFGDNSAILEGMGVDSGANYDESIPQDVTTEDPQASKPGGSVTPGDA